MAGRVDNSGEIESEVIARRAVRGPAGRGPPLFRKSNSSPEQRFATAWNRATDAEAAALGAVQAEFDAAIDTIAGILRSWGQTRLGLEQLDSPAFPAACEGWAKHVLIGSPYPGQPEEDLPARGVSREWSRLHRFAAERYEQEHEAVGAALADLRQVIWAFVEGLGGVLATDTETDDQLLARLRRLRGVVDGGSTEELKRAVLATVADVTSIIEQRDTARHTRLDELGQRLTSLATELQEDQSEGQLDSLTRLSNQAALNEHLARASNLQHLFGRTASLLRLDVDHFGWINDTYGRLAGDQVLTELAACLVRAFPRRSDCVARLGGDEFAVVLADTPLADAGRLAERFLQTARDLGISHRDETIRITMSAGVSDSTRGEPVEDWTARAGLALGLAKQAGGDRVAQAPAGLDVRAAALQGRRGGP